MYSCDFFAHVYGTNIRVFSLVILSSGTGVSPTLMGMKTGMTSLARTRGGIREGSSPTHHLLHRRGMHSRQKEPRSTLLDGWNYRRGGPRPRHSQFNQAHLGTAHLKGKACMSSRVRWHPLNRPSRHIRDSTLAVRETEQNRAKEILAVLNSSQVAKSSRVRPLTGLQPGSA